MSSFSPINDLKDNRPVDWRDLQHIKNSIADLGIALMNIDKRLDIAHCLHAEFQDLSYRVKTMEVILQSHINTHTDPVERRYADRRGVADLVYTGEMNDPA